MDEIERKRPKAEKEDTESQLLLQMFEKSAEALADTGGLEPEGGGKKNGKI